MIKRAACVAAAVAVLVTPLVTAPAAEGTLSSTNPLAGRAWGVYTGDQDGVYPAWQQATGTRKKLLAKVALRPRARWYGSWLTAQEVRTKIHQEIRDEQHGDPSVIVPLAIFRLWPNHESHKADPLTLAQRRAYRHWIDAAARGIGAARVLMILEPDLPVSLTGWRPAVRLSLANYAARKFSALPHTTIYLDGGANDWLTAARAATMLKSAGISHVRGFALSGTHYDSTGSNVIHGRAIIRALAHRGIPGKHFVVDTSDNSHPFTYSQYYATHPPGPYGGAVACRTKAEKVCVSLGIPPTTQVAGAAWHLSARVKRIARHWCDAYVWYNRPWLHNGTAPFSLTRTLRIARTSPY